MRQPRCATDEANRAAGSGAQKTAADPVVLTGVFLGTRAQPLRDARIRVDLEPSPQQQSAAASEVGVELAKLDEATTDDRGRFVLRSKIPADLTGYVDQDGSVSLLITSFDDGGELLYHVRATPPSPGVTHWSWSGEPDKKVAAPDSRSRAGANRPLKLQLRAQSDSASASVGRLGSGGAARMGLYSGNYCSYSWYWVRSDANIIFTWDRIQRIHTQARTSWKYEWSNHARTSQDAAANIGYGGALVSVGLTKIQTSAAGVTFGAGTYQSYDARVQYDNRAYSLYCVDSLSTRSWCSGKCEWRAYKWTGGNQKASPTTGIFSCNTAWRVPTSSPMWIARGSSYTYSAGASIGSLSLRTSQTNSSEHKLTFTPSGTAYLCGSNDYPIYARQVREV